MATYALIIANGDQLHLADPSNVFAAVCGAKYAEARQVGLVPGIVPGEGACPKCADLAPRVV